MKTKPEVFQDLLRAGLVRVYLDGREPGVRLPGKYLTEKVVILEYGYGLPKPIEGLEVDDYGIRAVLSFDGEKQRTVVPWSAVTAMCDSAGYGMAWDFGPENPLRATWGMA